MSNTVANAYPFLSSTKDHIDTAIQSVANQYSKIVTRGDAEFAMKQLRSQLREFVVYETKNQGYNMIERNQSLGINVSAQPIILEGKGTDSEPIKSFDWKKKEFLGGILGISVFTVLLSVPLMERAEEQNCLAMLALASIFWTLEVCGNKKLYNINHHAFDRSFRSLSLH